MHVYVNMRALHSFAIPIIPCEQKLMVGDLGMRLCIVHVFLSFTLSLCPSSHFCEHNTYYHNNSARYMYEFSHQSWVCVCHYMYIRNTCLSIKKLVVQLKAH